MAGGGGGVKSSYNATIQSLHLRQLKMMLPFIYHRHEHRTHLLKLFHSWTLSRRIHCYIPKTGFTACEEAPPGRYTTLGH